MSALKKQFKGYVTALAVTAATALTPLTANASSGAASGSASNPNGVATTAAAAAAGDSAANSNSASNSVSHGGAGGQGGTGGTATGGQGVGSVDLDGDNYNARTTALALSITPPDTDVAAFVARDKTACTSNISEQSSWSIFGSGSSNSEQTQEGVAGGFLLSKFVEDPETGEAKKVKTSLADYVSMSDEDLQFATEGLEPQELADISIGLCVAVQNNWSDETMDKKFAQDLQLVTLQLDAQKEIRGQELAADVEIAKINAKLNAFIAKLDFLDARLEAAEEHAGYKGALLESITTTQEGGTTKTTYGYVAGSLPRLSEEHHQVEKRAGEAWEEAKSYTLDLDF